MSRIHHQAAWFAVAGTIGFVVDAGVLYIMLLLGSGPYIGRIVSFFCAAFVTWQINRRVTFSPSRTRSILREWLEYLLAMALGGLCNYAIYAALIKLLPQGQLAPLSAVAGGSVAGMTINFLSAKLWVFRKGHTNESD
ncbi:polysaccharide synthesis protein GtrA [Burkholderia pseudomultivorans]|uniref:GtrA family protein n=1 Tax=Burkholderia pseudomultivorans TaxID=1207504 RepID=UPI0007563584|nr:GtrA family protein [Burkholderia pseudomultivorans]KVC46952.1 polysaccharide synthesis protein GtrA [Burkholderia pseudomultivorans]